MAVAPFAMFGMFEVLILAAGGGLFGLPPGELDPAFLKCAPEKTLVYIEWATRGSGKAGAKGIDGFMADPEVTAFIEAIERAIKSGVDRASDSGNPEQSVVAESVPTIVKMILNRSGCIYLDVASPDAAGDAGGAADAQPVFGNWAVILSRIRGIVIVNAGDQADEFQKKVSDLLQLIPNFEAEKLDHFTLPIPVPGVTLQIHRHKDYFIVGFGKGTIDAAIAGLDGKSQTKSLADNARFMKAYQQTSFERLGSRGWIDVKGIVDVVASIMGPQVPAIAKMIGADSLDSIITSNGVVDGELASKTLITTGGKPEGILSLVAGRAITADDFSLIPGDADFALAKSVSLSKILAAAKKIVGTADSNSLQMMEGMISAVEQQIGFSFEDDFFKAFGDVWTIHNSPASGGVFVTSLVASLEVRDPQKAYGIFTKLMNVLGKSLPPEFGNNFRRRAIILANKKFMDRSIYFVNTIGDDIPFAPAFCVTNKQLLFALHPQALKSHLRHLEEGGDSFALRFKRELKLPAGEPIFLSYFKSKELVRYLYAFAPYFGQVAVSNMQSFGGIEIDVFDLPSAKAVLPYTTNSSSSLTRTADGLLYESKGGLPIPGGMGSSVTMLQFMLLTSVRAVRLGGVQAIEADAVEVPADE